MRVLRTVALTTCGLAAVAVGFETADRLSEPSLQNLGRLVGAGIILAGSATVAALADWYVRRG